MKSALFLLGFITILYAETPEKIPSLQKALKLNSKQTADAAKATKESSPIPNTSFDPSFLLDVDDDFSFKDPLTDPIAAKEKEDHPERSTQVSPDVLGIPQTGSLIHSALPANPASAFSPQEVGSTTVRSNASNVFGPQLPDREPATNGQSIPTVTGQNFAPLMAGVNPFGAAISTNPLPPSTPAQPIVGVSDIAVLLANNQFFPSRIRLKEGIQTRLIFATLNKKPAALIIEKLQIQKWIAKQEKLEITREISSNKITEILLSPVRGNYTFHDALSGASGEIVVE